jgi:hypothetical protein
MKRVLFAVLVALSACDGATPTGTTSDPLRRISEDPPPPPDDPPPPSGEPAPSTSPAPSTPPVTTVPLTFRVVRAHCNRTSDAGGEDRDELYFLVSYNINYNVRSFRLPSADDYYEFWANNGWTDGYPQYWTNQDQRPIVGPIFADRISLNEGAFGQIEVLAMEQDSGEHDFLGRLTLQFRVQNGRIVIEGLNAGHPGVWNADYAAYYPNVPPKGQWALLGTDAYYQVDIEVL